MLHNVRVRRSTALLLVALLAPGCGAAPDGTADLISAAVTSAPRASVPANPVASPATAPRAADTSTTFRVEASAVATAPATRVPTVPDSLCEEIATTLAVDHPTTQFVVVRSDGWAATTAVLQVADRSGTGWTCGPEMTARVGKSGVRPLLERRSGDGATPAGVFGLGTMTAWDGQMYSFFGNDPDPGVAAGTYRRTRAGDCFGATPNTSGYGHLRNDTSCSSPDEYLPSIGAYTHAALIDANMEPDVSGDAPGEIPYAAAIFLHRFSYLNAAAATGATKPTSGCVSLAQPDLASVLVQLRPDVRFAVGPTQWLLAGASA